MQSASALQVTIRCFGVWNAALGVLVAAVISAVAGWFLSWHDEPAVRDGGVFFVLALVGLSGVFGLVRRQPIVLRWDAQRWHVTDPHRGRVDTQASDIRVVLDLGGWMLLKYRAETSPPSRRRSGWIPAQRRGIETQWHALRCALHVRAAAHMAPTLVDGQVQRG